MNRGSDDSNSSRQGSMGDANGDSLSGLTDDVWSDDFQAVPSIGDYLTKQRQLRGISQEELCTLTRIPLRSLERLESGAFDTLDDGFVRGFVRTVASALGLDPDDTLARMTQEPEVMAVGVERFASVGVMRFGLMAAGLVLVLISVGLVRIAVQYLPGQDVTSDLVMRRDPVRELVEARRGSNMDSNGALAESNGSNGATTEDLVIRVAPRAIDERDLPTLDGNAAPDALIQTKLETQADARAAAR